MTSSSPPRASGPLVEARTGQVALVTGGSSGLGFAIAEALARVGTIVIVSSRSEERCQAAAKKLSTETGGTVVGISCEITEEESVDNLVDSIVDRYGRLDVLVTGPARRLGDRSRISTLPRSGGAWTSTSWAPGSPAVPRSESCDQPDTAASSLWPARWALSEQPIGPGMPRARGQSCN